MGTANVSNLRCLAIRYGIMVFVHGPLTEEQDACFFVLGTETGGETGQVVDIGFGPKGDSAEIKLAFPGKSRKTRY
jgi:hypothetical protein